MPAVKKCRKCHVPQSVDAFYVSSANKDGRHSYCKQCLSKTRKVRYLANREEEIKAAAVYNKLHPEKNRERVKRCQQKDLARAHRLAKASRNRPEHKERRKDYMAKYGRDHAEAHADREARRRAQKRTTAVEPVLRREVHQRDCGCCYLCHNPITLNEMHLEHAVPLSRGGSHTYDNCRAACAGCNLSKGAKLPREMVA